MKLVGGQLAAVLADEREILVSAAAGSGKTTVLTERIMEMICRDKSPVDVDRLLVVTFTDAAAKQMKAKISEKLIARMKSRFGDPHLARQVALLNRAQIMTIHAFCLTVVRKYFHILDIDPGFRVGSQAELALLRGEVVDEVFERAYVAYYENGENPAFIEAARHFAPKIDDSSFKELVLRIYDFAWSCPNPRAWLDEHIAQYRLESGIDGSRWYADFCVQTNLVLENAIANLEELAEIAATPGLPPKNLELFERNIGDLINAQAALAQGFAAFYDAMDFEAGALSSAKTRPQGDLYTDEELAARRERLKAGRKQYFTDVVREIREGALQKPPAAAEADLQACHPIAAELGRLVLDFAADFAAVKAERNMVDFSDFEHFCLEILGKMEGGEFIAGELAEQVAAQFDEVFVDEYQDSSMLQELILKTVASASRRFMVGDIKQSIYRFRLARPENFISKFNTFSREPNPENPAERLINLSQNFRSRAEVLAGINFVFGQLMSREAGEVDYDDEAKLIPGASFPDFNISGKRCILHIVDKAMDGEPDSDEEDDGQDLTRAAVEARVAAGYVRDLISKKFQIFEDGEQRDIRFSDIVILLRAKSAGPIFVQEMKNLDIPAMCEGDNDYFSATEVLTILAILQIIDNPRQDTPLISVMYSPIFRFCADELVEIRMARQKGDYYGALRHYAEAGRDDSLKEKIAKFLAELENWRDLAVFLPVSQLILTLYEQTGFLDYVGLLLGGNIRQANLNLLFEKAAEFEKTSLMGLFNFMRYIEKLQKRNFGFETAAAASENENLVRIMTIHKSKGLEFPVVILADCGRKLNLRDTQGNFLMHWDLGMGFRAVKGQIISNTFARHAISARIQAESLSEELRVLYVALTRAKEKLILIGTTDNYLNKLTNYQKISKSDFFQIPAYDVLNGKSYLDWMIMAMMRNNGDWEVVSGSPGESRAQIRQKRQSYAAFGEILEKIENHEPGPQMAEIRRRLDFRYAYENGLASPSKMSVSEVKRLYEREFLGDSEIFINKPTTFDLPDFMRENTGPTAAERGVIFHKVLEHLDLAQTSLGDDFIPDLENKGILLPGEAAHIDLSRIDKFLASPIVARMRRAERIYREMRFAIGVDPCLIDSRLENSGGDMILHGVIDCIFEESGGLVILDYKTDRIGAGGVNAIAQPYRAQMMLYKLAAERIFNKPVKEMLLYFFSIEATYQFEMG